MSLKSTRVERLAGFIIHFVSFQPKQKKVPQLLLRHLHVYAVDVGIAARKCRSKSNRRIYYRPFRMRTVNDAGANTILKSVGSTFFLISVFITVFSFVAELTPYKLFPV